MEQEPLGWVAWWSIDCDLRFTGQELTDIMLASKAFRMTLPGQPSGADTFRSLTRTARHEYREEDRKIVIGLFPVESPKNMITRHIVRTVRRGEATLSATRVGEAVFVRPRRKNDPRDQGVMKVQVKRVDPHVTAFANHLRRDYKRRLETFSDRTARRMIRELLASMDTVLVDDVYFLRKEEDVQRLDTMVRGFQGRCNYVQVPDDETHRQKLAEWQTLRGPADDDSAA